MDSRPPSHPRDPQRADRIYIADTDRVTAQQLYGGEGADGSRLVEGGLRQEEGAALWAAVGEGVPLVAELVTSGSPTDSTARARIESLLGTEWTG